MTTSNTDVTPKDPAWMIGLDAEGVTVLLSVPSKVNGLTVDRVYLRSPTLGEVRKVQKIHKNDDEAREMLLFSSLTDMGPEDLEGLRLKDYTRVQTAYFRLGDEDES